MINFLKYSWLYYAISLIVIGSGLFSVVRWGYVYSIDFVGGTNINYEFSKKTDQKTINQAFKSRGVQIISLKVSGNQLTARTKAIDEKKEAELKKELEQKTSSKLKVLKSETVGPTLGKETLYKTLIASAISVLVILGYMSFAFKGFDFALAAIIALFHDMLVVFGSYSLLSHFFGAEVDTMFVTAILISMSFSVHDTIVIFDKVREYLKTERNANPDHLINRALTETLVRSTNNSMTIIFMLLALSLLGGDAIRFFVITLLIGTVTGTYSSPFVASPILALIRKRYHKAK